MSSSEKSNEELQVEIALLRRELADLKREKADLELLIEMSVEHGDYVENDLLNKVESTLRESGRWFRLLSETIPIPIFVNRVSDNTIMYANEPAAVFLGLPLEKLLGRTITDFYDPEIRQSLAEAIAANENISNYELQGKRSDEKVFWGALSIQPLTFNDEPCLLSVLFDLTERKETEEKSRKHQEELEWLVAERTYELTRSNEMLAEAIREQKQRVLEMAQLNHMSDLLHACRTEQEAHEVVIGVCKQLFPNDSGYLGIIDDSRTRLDIAANWGSSPPKVKLLNLEDCWALRRGKSHFVESSEIGPLCPHLSRAPGYSYLCEPIIAQEKILGVMHLRIGRGEQVESDEAFKLMIESKQIMLVRIVEHYSLSLVNLRLHETLKRQSIQDPLTNLYNRRYMEESLERELSRCRRHKLPLTIIMIDIDHFKTFNDTYGHIAGDIILQKLGEFLKKHIREEDIACRYGGEEFVLILPQTSPEPVRQRAEQIRSKVEENLRIRYQGNILGITISMGIAGFPDHGVNLNEILGTADLALYQAKEKGRNRVEVAVKTK